MSTAALEHLRTGEETPLYRLKNFLLTECLYAKQNLYSEGP